LESPSLANSSRCLIKSQLLRFAHSRSCFMRTSTQLPRSFSPAILNLSVIKQQIKGELDQILRSALEKRRLQRREVRSADVIQSDDLAVGDDLRSLPLSERKERLKKHLGNTDSARNPLRGSLVRRG
jgi:hypothetical protein